MPETTREEKLKLMEKLPQELQDFLYSEDTGAFLLYLGEKYNLDDEKVSALSKIVGNIVLKIAPITSLAQEIADKVVSEPQTAMAITQELNSELLTPVLMPAKNVPSATVPPTFRAQAPLLSADRYREPVSETPGIVDLRKTPPQPMRLPVAAAPIPPSPRSVVPSVILPLTATVEPVLPPVAPKTGPPLTFTKPIEKIIPTSPLIEADPHRTPALTQTLRPPVPEVRVLTPVERGIGVEAEPHKEPLKTTREEKPQFIVRPPGLPPTDFPRGVLDLRKDKGEF